MKFNRINSIRRRVPSHGQLTTHTELDVFVDLHRGGGNRGNGWCREPVLYCGRLHPHRDGGSDGCGFVDFGRYSLRCQGLVLDAESGERRVLLVRFEDGVWHFPGGHVDCEETAEVSVVREVKEEVGLDCRVVGLVAFRNRVDPDRNESTAVFLLERMGGDLRPDPAEVTELGFFAAEQVRTLHLFPLPLEVALGAFGNTLRVLPPVSIHERERKPVTIYVGQTWQAEPSEGG